MNFDRAAGYRDRHRGRHAMKAAARRAVPPKTGWPRPPVMGRPAWTVAGVTLQVVLWALAGIAPARAQAQTCTPAREVVERFLPADCADCWQRPEGPAQPASSWVLDWIVPAGDASAALAAAALPEAAERRRLVAATSSNTGSDTGTGTGTDAGTDASPLQVRHRLPAQAALRLHVAGGPAWNGYLGLELGSRGRPPAGATAYLALVEDIDAGEEGSPVARRLVRAVVGPLGLDASGRASTELRALRIPEGARPERLRGAAWWVDGRGRIGGLVREGCPAGR